MGFSGGGANVTKAHTHSSSIVQDGGALNFDNVTQASLAAGDITYSDGAALQVLGIGSPSDSLVVNGAGTLPEWAAAGGGFSTNSLIAQTAGNRTTTSGTFANITDLEITLSNHAGGIATIVSCNSVTANDHNRNLDIRIGDDGSSVSSTQIRAQMDENGTNYICMSTAHTMETDGSVITLMAKTEAGTQMTFVNASCFIMASEIYSA